LEKDNILIYFTFRIEKKKHGGYGGEEKFNNDQGVRK